MEPIDAELMGNGQAGVPEVAGGKDLSTEVVANAIKYELQSSMMLAQQYPRNIEQSRAKILKTCKRPGFAKKVRYFKPIGAKKITGISVRSAEMLANLWGNIKSISYVMFDEEGDDTRKIPGRRILYVMSIDLESNTSYSSQVILEKTVERSYVRKGQLVYSQRTNSKGGATYIVKPTEDEFTVKEKKSLAIEKRNTILALIPYDIKEEMLERSDETNNSAIKEDPDKALRTILDYFSDINILPNEIEEYLDHPIATISPAEIADLRTVAQSIQSGASTWQDFKDLAAAGRRKKKAPPKKPESGSEGQTAADKIKERASAAAETKKNATSAPRPAPSASPPASTEQESDYIEYSAFEQLVKESGDKETLLSCKEFIQKLDPAYFDEAYSLIDRYASKLKEASAKNKEPEALPLAKRLKVALRKLTPEQRATYAKIVFNSERATDIKVDDLDEKQVETLKNTMTSADHFEE